jgi:hypothetical protein
MVGDERVRFCGQCNLNVYNLSAMTKVDAERLISRAEGKLCVRYYRRADGTILTSNCPVGLRALKRRLSRIAGASAAAVLSFLGGILAVTGLRQRPMIPAATQGSIYIKTTDRPWDNQPVMGTYGLTPDVRGRETMGEVIKPTIGRAASPTGRIRK